MISSLDGEPFEPVVESDLDFVLSLQDLHLIPAINDSCEITVNVLKSAHQPVQDEYFTAAFELISQHVPSIFKRIKKENKINKQIRDTDMLPKDVVDWLLSSHIHIIYSHVHQGYVHILFVKFNFKSLFLL